MERHFGSFHREISIPENAKADEISAVYENGVLKVTIPKTKIVSTKKQITIN
jgi:HSP20 family protein